jgi:hypothetical protein
MLAAPDGHSAEMDGHSLKQQALTALDAISSRCPEGRQHSETSARGTFSSCEHDRWIEVPHCADPCFLTSDGTFLVVNRENGMRTLYHLPTRKSADTTRWGDLRVKWLKIDSALPEWKQGSAVRPEFLCPLSGNTLHDPTIAADGVTYEREYIERWISNGNVVSPVYGTPLPHTELVPNTNLPIIMEKHFHRH